jgi:chromosome partitioning protein
VLYNGKQLRETNMQRNQNRIAVTNNKGGVGKTTTLIEICAHAVEAQKRVLVIDNDPQGNASRILLGYIPKVKDLTIFDLLIGEAEVTDVVKKATENWPRVYVIGANQKLESAHKFLESQPGWETALDDVVESIEDNFDIVLIDSPPNLGFLTKIAIRAANKIIIPTDTSVYAEDGLTKILALIENIETKTKHKVDVVRIVLAALQKGGAHSTRNTIAKLKTSYKDLFLPVELPHTTKVSDAQREAIPKAAAQILDHDHKLYKGYKELLISLTT